MEDNKIISKLYRYKSIMLNSFGGTVVFAIFLGIFLGIGNVYSNVFINELLTVFSIATGVSLGTFIFSSVKQLNYQEQLDKIEKQIEQDYLSKDILKEDDQVSKTIEACKCSMSNNQHIDNTRQIDKTISIPNNNGVLQLVKRKK
jgi:hypothetical protein